MLPSMLAFPPLSFPEEFVSPSRAFAMAAVLGRTTAFLMFGLMVLGAIVRTTGSGLACPDWPLCEGRLIPRLQFNVLIEWGHRMAALLVSVMLFVTAAWVLARRQLRARLGGLIGLAVVLLFVQILLGALTVWKLLSPAVVSSHLAVAVLLFVSLLVFSLRADTHADLEEAGAASAAPPAAPGLAAAFAVVAVLTYAQVVLGGLVSTNHASTVCPDWPTCRGEWFPAMTGLVGIHMLHRFGGYLVALSVLMLALAARGESLPVRAGARAAFTLVVAQVILGVCNVLLAVPVWVSTMHLATAVALLATLVITTYRLASAPVMRPALVPAEAR